MALKGVSPAKFSEHRFPAVVAASHSKPYPRSRRALSVFAPQAVPSLGVYVAVLVDYRDKDEVEVFWQLGNAAHFAIARYEAVSQVIDCAGTNPLPIIHATSN